MTEPFRVNPREPATWQDYLRESARLVAEERMRFGPDYGRRPPVDVDAMKEEIAVSR
jgi:hypothetical protein